jgi:hypothetical protein
MKRLCSWILIAVTAGVLTACAGMNTSVYESTPVNPASVAPSAGD